MSDDKRISYLKNKGEIVARKKDWMKKLEALSGKPLDTGKLAGVVYLVVDCSASMDGNKLEQAKSGGEGFAREAQRKGYAIGLIQFDSDAKHLLDPQRELTNFHTSIKKLAIGGSTNMAAGIRTAIANLSDRSSDRTICIVTDGQPDDRNATLNTANEAKSLGIEIMTIGTDDADKSFLEELATRKELSIKVVNAQLQQGITSMAKMLPDKT